MRAHAQTHCPHAQRQQRESDVQQPLTNRPVPMAHGIWRDAVWRMDCGRMADRLWYMRIFCCSTPSGNTWLLFAAKLSAVPSCCVALFLPPLRPYAMSECAAPSGVREKMKPTGVSMAQSATAAQPDSMSPALGGEAAIVMASVGASLKSLFPQHDSSALRRLATWPLVCSHDDLRPGP